MAHTPASVSVSARLRLRDACLRRAEQAIDLRGLRINDLPLRRQRPLLRIELQALLAQALLNTLQARGHVLRLRQRARRERGQSKNRGQRRTSVKTKFLRQRRPR